MIPFLLPLLLAQAGPPPAFPTALPGRVFQFPRDHGAHPEFRTEWWYFTGHLWNGAGQRYGYQLTFFRSALPAGAWKGSAAWRSDQIHLAHAALTQVQGGRFTTEERLNREGLVAGAATTGLDLRNASWTAKAQGDRIHLSFAVGRSRLELDLDPTTPPVVFGEDGVSRKGADPTAASHYLTFPRLATTGTLTGPGGRAATLQGRSWMDHEFSSSQLSAGQVGWDWAGIQLRDGHSLMVYRLRGRDGAQDPYSLVTEVDAAGKVLRSTHDFRLTGGRWQSPRSKAVYPLPLRLEAWGRTLTLEPVVADQELRTRQGAGITYWEGACRVLDGQGREGGDAYVELTGYAHSMQGRF
jgi:predicted secreted hydrolase